MNKPSAPASDAPTQILTGRTEVIVKRRNINERTGKETIDVIHKGIVVQQNSVGSWVRVYNPLPTNQGGDTSPENSEWFPFASKLCWCEITYQREENRAMIIPPTLRH